MSESDGVHKSVTVCMSAGPAAGARLGDGDVQRGHQCRLQRRQRGRRRRPQPAAPLAACCAAEVSAPLLAPGLTCPPPARRRTRCARRTARSWWRWARPSCATCPTPGTPWSTTCARAMPVPIPLITLTLINTPAQNCLAILACVCVVWCNLVFLVWCWLFLLECVCASVCCQYCM